MKKLFQSAVLLSAAFGLVMAQPALAEHRSGKAKHGGTFTYGVKAVPPTYDLQGSTSYGTLHRVEQHYSLLLTFDWENFPKIVGDVAESWNVSDDQLTYTFNIRKGIKFHDGTPLTAADVKASYERLISPKEGIISPRKALFTAIGSIDTPDDYTVVIKFKGPDAFGLSIFAMPYNGIYAAKDIAKEGNWHAKNINGTGPFQFVEHVAGEKWVAKRYEDYHFDDVYLDGTVGYKIKDITNPMVGGQIMAEMRSVSPPERANLTKQMGSAISFHEKPLLSQWMVTLNSAFKPFQDKRVRQALTLCIDRHKGLENLSKITFTGRRTGFVLYGTEYAMSDEELDKLIGFSPDINASRAKAKQLLKEAGYEGLEFRYSNRGVAHPYDHMAIFLIASWKACGLNPKMETNPSSKFVSIRRNGGFDASIDWNASFLPDPTLMLTKYQSKSINPQNYAFVESPEFDKLYAQMTKELDVEKRKAMTHELEKIANEEAWFLPIAYAARVVPMLSKAKGYHITYTHAANNDWRGIWLEE